MHGAAHRSQSRQARPFRHAQFELAKWLAVAAMTIDHYGKIVDPSVYSQTNAVGRVAFPLFAWIIGSRLAMDAGLSRRYLRYLVPWALVSQPIYVWVGKSWAEPNIFFTLAAGVAVQLAVQEWRNPAIVASVFAAVLALLAVGADYGVFGLFMIPAVAALSASNARLGALCAGPLGVLSNVIARPPYLGPGALWALLASLIAWISGRSQVGVWRLPKLAFYAYYPLHLVVLNLVARA